MIKQIKPFVASSLLALSSSILPVVLPSLVAVSTVTLFAESAQARIVTVPLILRKVFSCNYNNFCEVMVVSQDTGKIYKMEYHGRIGANESNEIMIEINDITNKWLKVINPVNGKSSYRIISVEQLK